MLAISKYLKGKATLNSDEILYTLHGASAQKRFEIQNENKVSNNAFSTLNHSISSNNTTTGYNNTAGNRNTNIDSNNSTTDAQTTLNNNTTIKNDEDINRSNNNFSNFQNYAKQRACQIRKRNQKSCIGRMNKNDCYVQESTDCNCRPPPFETCECPCVRNFLEDRECCVCDLPEVVSRPPHCYPSNHQPSYYDSRDISQDPCFESLSSQMISRPGGGTRKCFNPPNYLPNREQISRNHYMDEPNFNSTEFVEENEDDSEEGNERLENCINLEAQMRIQQEQQRLQQQKVQNQQFLQQQAQENINIHQHLRHLVNQQDIILQQQHCLQEHLIKQNVLLDNQNRLHKQRSSLKMCKRCIVNNSNRNRVTFKPMPMSIPLQYCQPPLNSYPMPCPKHTIINCPSIILQKEKDRGTGLNSFDYISSNYNNNVVGDEENDHFENMHPPLFKRNRNKY